MDDDRCWPEPDCREETPHQLLMRKADEADREAAESGMRAAKLRMEADVSDAQMAAHGERARRLRDAARLVDANSK